MDNQLKRPETAAILIRVDKQIYRAMRTLQPAVADSAIAKKVANWVADLITLQKAINDTLQRGH